MTAFQPALSKDVSGVIASLDWSIRKIVLDDGVTYTVARGINLAKFKIGDKVTLEIDDEKKIVMKLTMADQLPPPLQMKRKSRGY